MKNLSKLLKRNRGLSTVLLLAMFCALFVAPSAIVSADPACAAPTVYNLAMGECVAPSASGGSGASSTSPKTSSTPKVTQYAPSGSQIDPALKGGNCANLNKCDLITSYIDPAIKFLTAFVGVGVTIAIVYGGIEYGSSGGDPSKAAAGKNRIRNALFTLLAFFFLYALLNFLIPGGING